MVCNLVAKAIWEWTIPRNVWLSAAYIPGSQNKIADFKSRHFDENTEWSLSPVLFARLSHVFYIPWVELFASRLNRQVDLFVSWKPEPEAWAVDAFSIAWRDIKFYAFPPFSVLSRVLSKIKRGQCFRHFGGALVAYTAVVPCEARSVDRSSSTYRTRFEEPAHPGKSTLFTRD